MITLLLLFLGWFLIMWAAMTLAVSFYMAYGIVWIIAKIFKSTKLEVKANNIRRKSSMKYWANKSEAKKESRKIAKETNINDIVDSKFDEPETFSEAFSQGLQRGRMKREMKKQAKIEKKQAKLQAKIDKKNNKEIAQ